MTTENVSIMDLVNSTDAHVHQLGMLLDGIAEELKEGKLTQDEFTSLMIDAEKLRKVISATNGILLDVKIHQAIEGLIELAKMAKI